jgi:ABC-2 type transporter
MLLMMILSGFAFPIASMPLLFQDLSYLSPVRYFLVIIRGSFLKGTGIDTPWPPVNPPALLAAVIFTMSVRRRRTGRWDDGWFSEGGQGAAKNAHDQRRGPEDPERSFEAVLGAPGTIPCW